MGVPVKRIKSFMEAALSRHDELELVLYHVNVSGRQSRVWGPESKWTMDDVTPIIAESARAYANGLSGATNFRLVAYQVGEEGQNPINVMSFTLMAEGGGGDDDGLSEPATDQGLLAQLMRHNNELHRQSSGTVGMMFGYMTGIIERQSHQIEKMTNDRMRHAEVMEDIVSKKHERDIDMDNRKIKQKRTDEMLSKVLSLLPVAINKLAGKELVRQNDTLFEITSAEYIQSIKPEQLDGMLQSGLIDKNQLTLLSTMLEQVNKRMLTAEDKNEGSEKAKKAATGNLGTLSMLSGLISMGGK